MKKLPNSFRLLFVVYYFRASFFFVKTCNLIFIWKEKSYFPFFFWRDLFYKIDVQRKSQHQEETFLGQPPNWKIKREIQNQNHFHYDYMITLANTLNIWFMYLYYIMSISLLRDFVSLLRYTILSSEQMIALLVIMTPCFITFYLNMILYKRNSGVCCVQTWALFTVTNCVNQTAQDCSRSGFNIHNIY